MFLSITCLTIKRRLFGGIASTSTDSPSKFLHLVSVFFCRARLQIEDFLKRTKSRFDISIFRNAREETLALTEQTNRIEREIDECVAELYGVKLEK